MINKNYHDIVNLISEKIIHLKKNKKNLFFLLSGSQGSGKTTFSSFLKKKLTQKKLKVLVLSIDNFYLSKQKRLQLSKKISPLFKTRGVPGTHDLKLLIKILKYFKSNKKITYRFPYFSKSHDDILKSKYMKLLFPYDVFILEGWCVGVKDVSPKYLLKPVNSMEAKLDKDLIWRKYVNQKCKEYYKKIFSKADHSLFLKIPNFHHVFRWRKQQEQQIPKSLRMNDKQLKTFISFYERITKNLLKKYKSYFQSVIQVLPNHNFKLIK